MFPSTCVEREERVGRSPSARDFAAVGKFEGRLLELANMFINFANRLGSSLGAILQAGNAFGIPPDCILFMKSGLTQKEHPKNVSCSDRFE